MIDSVCVYERLESLCILDSVLSYVLTYMHTCPRKHPEFLKRSARAHRLLNIRSHINAHILAMVEEELSGGNSAVSKSGSDTITRTHSHKRPHTPPRLKLQRLALSEEDRSENVCLSHGNLTFTHESRPSTHPTWGMVRSTQGPRKVLYVCVSIRVFEACMMYTCVRVVLKRVCVFVLISCM